MSQQSQRIFLVGCMAALSSLRFLSTHPASGQAIELAVSPASGSGDQVRSHTISCTLDASLTSIEKTTSLTVYASKRNGRVGEFDPLVSLDLWSSGPQMMGDVEASDIDVLGRIGSDSDTKSQLTFSWKSPRNGYPRQYKCVANGLDRSGRVVTISITSDAAIRSRQITDGTTTANLRLLTNAILGEVTNSTVDLKDSVQIVHTKVDALQKNVDTLEELVKTQNATIAKLEERITSFTEMYRFTYVMSNFDVSDVFQGSRYYVSKVVAPFNIQAADSLCAMLGGYLVEIGGDAEYNFVFNFVKHVGGTDNFYTGGNDIAEEGVWRFWHSKKPVTFLKWTSPGQPDNGSGIEDCIEIKLTHRGYNDWGCNRVAKFVCEGP